jgi:hypothetical protein
MGAFTPLELQILEAICVAREEDGGVLASILASADVRDREITGPGFFTYFDVPRGIPSPYRGWKIIYGPGAEVEMGGEEALMSFMLWVEDDWPACLEGYQYTDVDLKDHRLSDLRARRVGWHM